MTTSSPDPLTQLRSDVEREMDVMTAVATGGPRIQDADAEYRKRRSRIRRLTDQFGLEDPNPHPDLWAWYGKWSRDLGTYAERRSYVRRLFAPLLQRIDDLQSDSLGSGLAETEVTGWDAVDGQVAQLRIRLASCATSEDAQAVGLLCRDIMISLANAAYDEDEHGAVGVGAVERLNAVVGYLAAGTANERLRRLLKSTIDYANTVQHRRECSPAEAGIVAEATVAAVNLVWRLSQFPVP